MGLVRASCLREAKHQHELDEDIEEGDTGSAHAHQQVSASRRSPPAYPESPQSTHSPRRLSQRHSTPPKSTFMSYLPDDGGRRLSSLDNASQADSIVSSPETPLHDRPESRIYDIAEGSVYQEVDEAFCNQSESRVYAEVGRDVPEHDDQQVRNGGGSRHWCSDRW